MGLSRAMIDAFVDAGGTVEQLAAMMKADLDEQDARKAQKRAGNAERQRRFKAKRRPVTSDNADNALPSVTPPNDIYSNPPVSSDEETTPPAKVTKLVPAKPAEVRDQTWADFLDLRKRKRAPLTQTALDGIKSEADKAGWSMEAALAKCLARGWQGFEADWVRSDDGKPPGASGSMSQSILAKQNEAVIQ